MRCDTLLRGGRVIDPAQALDGTLDVAVRDGRIAAVAAGLPPGAAREVVDVAGRLVLPGLVDTHAHVYRHVTGRFGLDADLVGVHSGVTTVVDQGGPSCMTLPGFRRFIVEPAATRVYAFLSAYLVGGLEGHYYPALYRPDCVDVEATVRAARENRDLVRGLKAHAELGGFARWGSEVLRLSARIAREADLPLYVHFGQLWPLPEAGAGGVDPDGILPEVVELLRPGDILAHPFTRHPGGFVDRRGCVHPVVREALARGLRVDVGHGSHFSFRMARIAIAAGIVPDTLGADMHGYNTAVPPPAGTPASHPDPETHMFAGQARFSLASAMTSLIACGLTLEQVVPMVTANAARMLGLGDEVGTLRPGAVADVTVLDDRRGRWALRDNEGTRVTAERLLVPFFCLRAGRRVDADAPILPVAEAA
ncbi:MAG TPA: amidohydrolase/deacetylase family metallohydrolase [Methylomirabilota bacterium]|nr:amidohydrolase/deacetylase family metallohydrolase [Methylomirabilota bacterium]